jgi:hypothetical protein
LSIPAWWREYKAECPGWNARLDVYNLCFASSTVNGTAVVVRGESPIDLRNEIRRAEANPRSWWEPKS